MTSNPSYQRQINRLRDSIFRRWWLITSVLWLTIGVGSLWVLREDIKLLHEYFTWTGLRYSLVYNRAAGLCLALCIGLTVALLIAESRHILLGMTQGERERLEKKLHQIHQQGRSHPLWSHIVGPEEDMS